MCNLIICLFLQLIDEQEQYYAFLRELKRHPWKNIPSKSDAKIKDPCSHLEEYRSYMAFSFNVDGYMETLRVLENVLDSYNLSTIVNRIINAKKMQDIDTKLKKIDNERQLINDNKRKLVDMDMDEETLFKRKSADTQTYVDAVAAGSDSSEGEAVATVGEGGNKGATGVAGGGGGATEGGATGGGAEGGEGAMGDLTDAVRLSTVRPPSPAKDEPAAGGEYGGGNGV